MQIDLGDRLHGREQIRLFALFQAAHGFCQHLVVELKTNLQHVAALLIAEHFTCPAYF